MLAILDALGLVERSPIDFPDKVENYDGDRDVVLFAARAGATELTCAISGEALEDHFGAKGRSQRARLAAFRAHRAAIEDAARRKFIASQKEPDGSILIRSGDVTASARS